MLVKVYTGSDEVIVLPIEDGEAVGVEDYFGESLGRDIEDYNVMLSELPLLVRAGIDCRAEREFSQ